LDRIKKIHVSKALSRPNPDLVLWLFAGYTITVVSLCLGL
jgi:hypothetical protein